MRIGIFVTGILLTGIVFLVILVVTAFIADGGVDDLAGNLPWGLTVTGAFLLLMSFGMRVQAKDQDEENYALAQALPLPLKMASPGERLWARGEIHCDAPLQAPFFNLNVAYYHYTRERKKLTPGTGERRSSKNWIIEEDETQHTKWGVGDGTAKLLVDSHAADYRDLLEKTTAAGKERHKIKYLPATGSISVVGVVGADGHHLEKPDDGNLMILRQSREEWSKKSEAAEAWTRDLGMFFLWPALVGLLWGIGALTGVVAEPAVNGAGVILPLVIGTVLALIAWVIGSRNRFIACQARIQHAWSTIDVVLRARHNTITALAEVVRGYTEHEADTLTTVAALRGGESGVATVADAEQGDRLARELIVTAEAYPDLKANAHHAKLIEQLKEHETKAAHARTVYNEVIREYNEAVETFPASLVAGIAGFESVPYWQGESSAATAPGVSTSSEQKQENAPAEKADTPKPAPETSESAAKEPEGDSASAGPPPERPE